jgi:ABC-type Na+ efflux pump permease subunit
VALAIMQHRGEGFMVVGSVWFFISLIMVSAMLPLVGIVGERKNKNLPFLMSLPISAMQYTTSKLVSSFGMFLLPWLTLLFAAVFMIEVRHILPPGVIPMLVILALLPFIGFCLTTAAGLVGETEGWGIGANVFCQTSYGLSWYFLARIPALHDNFIRSSPEWNSTARSILTSEIGLVLLILGITFLFQARKRDFV